MKNDLISKKVTNEGCRIFSLVFQDQSHIEVLIAVMSDKDASHQNKYWFSLFETINKQYIGDPIGVIYDNEIKIDAISEFYFKRHRINGKPQVTEVTERYK